MSLSGDGDFGLGQKDPFRANLTDMGLDGRDPVRLPGAKAEFAGGGTMDLFRADAAAATQPNMLESLTGAIFDPKEPKQYAAPEKPKQSLLASIGVSFTMPSNVKGMLRSSDKAIKDKPETDQKLTSAKESLGAQRETAKAQFNDMKSAARLVAMDKAVSMGQKPDALLPTDPSRDTFKLENIGAAVASAKVAGPAAPFVQALAAVNTAAQEVTSPPPLSAKERGKALKDIEAEIKARASQSEESQRVKQAHKAPTFSGGGKQAASTVSQGPDQGRQSVLPKDFYETQGYQDLEKAVVAGHGLEEILNADFNQLDEVMALDQVSKDIDYVLEQNDYAADHMQLNADTLEAAIERGAKVDVEAPVREDLAGDVSMARLTLHENSPVTLDIPGLGSLRSSINLKPEPQPEINEPLQLAQYNVNNLKVTGLNL